MPDVQVKAHPPIHILAHAHVLHRHVVVLAVLGVAQQRELAAVQRSFAHVVLAVIRSFQLHLAFGLGHVSVLVAVAPRFSIRARRRLVRDALEDLDAPELGGHHAVPVVNLREPRREIRLYLLFRELHRRLRRALRLQLRLELLRERLEVKVRSVRPSFAALGFPLGELFRGDLGGSFLARGASGDFGAARPWVEGFVNLALEAVHEPVHGEGARGHDGGAAACGAHARRDAGDASRAGRERARGDGL
mmetsp:Transcript_12648/g.58468  ORF Transcript_12648/g.58468 Transcript_12648/m.58468 type:complete len:248 (+) Transcript_12648:481-1224(+)